MTWKKKSGKKLKSIFWECPRFSIWYLFSNNMYEHWTLESNPKVHVISLHPGDFGTSEKMVQISSQSLNYNDFYELFKIFSWFREQIFKMSLELKRWEMDPWAL